MNSKHNKNLTPNSQNLRKNMTPEEKRLWYNFLRDLPITVNRQKIIGKYIVDFYCAERKTVIEIDGTHHQEDYFKNQDEIREEYLINLGLKIIRYSNFEINNNFDGVCNDILKKLGLSTIDLI